MTHRVVFSPRARIDVNEALRWIIGRSPRAADRWYARFEKDVARLSDHPERQPIAEEETEILGVVVRQMLHGRRRGVYRILFTIEDDAVIIHSVRHAARGSIEP